MRKILLILLLFVSVQSFASRKYWVSLTAAAWNSTAGTKWATSSGGTGGAAVPTTTDSVFFDANSGTAVDTISVAQSCGSLDFTGFTGSIYEGAVSITINNGSFTYYSGMTQVGANKLGVIFSTGSSSSKLTTAGKNMNSISIGANNTTVTLQDNLSGAGMTFSGVGGVGSSFIANGHNITLSANLTLSNTTTVNLGSGTWTFTSSGTLAVSAGTIIASTSLIRITGTATNITGGGQTYYDLSITSSSNPHNIIGNNTFHNLYDSTTLASHTITLPNNGYTTVTNLKISGTNTSTHKLTSVGGGNPTYLQCTSGTQAQDYISIQDIHAYGGATFTKGSHSTCVGADNVGWDCGCGIGIMQWFEN